MTGQGGPITSLPQMAGCMARRMLRQEMPERQAGSVPLPDAFLLEQPRMPRLNQVETPVNTQLGEHHCQHRMQ